MREWTAAVLFGGGVISLLARRSPPMPPAASKLASPEEAATAVAARLALAVRMTAADWAARLRSSNSCEKSRFELSKDPI